MAIGEWKSTEHDMFVLFIIIGFIKFRVFHFKILLEVLLLKISIKVKKKPNQLSMYLVYTLFSSWRKDSRKKVNEMKVTKRENEKYMNHDY